MPVYQPIPCRATKAAIQSAAERYAQKIGFVPGSSIIDVVEGLGGRIVYRDFFLNPANRSESIHVRAEHDFEIFLPHETSTSRDRFTIAHELAHFLLHYPRVLERHRGENPIEMTADRYLPSDANPVLTRCEWEANWFAAAFLMPSDDFVSYWVKTGGNIKAIATRFLVSTAAAENRVKSLTESGKL